MMDFVMEYIMPAFMILLMIFTVLLLIAFFKENFIESTDYCICEKVSD